MARRETGQLTESPPKFPRRWFRFSLASMLLLIAIFGVWLGAKANRAHKQMRAVDTIIGWGGRVSYDYESDGSEQPPFPVWLRNLLPHDYLATVRVVRLDKSHVTDDDLRVLTGLPDLVGIHLQDTKVSDAGVRHLSGLTKLQVLILNGTDCTDTGLESLNSLTDMRILGLNLTQVTDEGLVAVHTMEFLSALFLSGTRVSDAGLAHLQGLKYLEDLDISGTRITEAGLSQLRELPALYILMVSRRLLTSTGISELKGFPKLTSLYFESSDDWATTHADLKQALPGLRAAPYTLPQRPTDK